MPAASAIASPPRPQARGTRTSPAANSRPQLWHWYSGSSATAVKRPAVRTAGAETAHGPISFSHTWARQSTAMPTRS